MKVKVISKSSNDEVRERVGDIQKVRRNVDPQLHKFEKAREYVRTMRAVKLEKMFAKPFLASLGDGHLDGVYVLSKDKLGRNIDRALSGSGDGSIKSWSLSNQAEEYRIERAHSGMIGGIVVVDESKMLSCSGMDSKIKLWKNEGEKVIRQEERYYASENGEGHMSIDTHANGKQFASCNSKIYIYDVNRSKPVSSIRHNESGEGTITRVKFNMSEANVLGSCASSDRSITLYDIRTNMAVVKITMALKANAMSWNPMEPFTFAVGSEDHNAYIFDMRNTKHSKNVLKDHVGSVLDIDYAPTGRELVTASYDKTVRIFSTSTGHSRDMYHSKRMQHVFAAMFSLDSRYILSGSDDGNVRLWRSHASDRADSAVSYRQRSALEYSQALRSKYSHLPEISRIAKQHPTAIPKYIRSARSLKQTILESQKRKQENVAKHSKDFSFKNEREKHIIKNTF